MAIRISRDPILSKAFKDMSEAEFELAKLEVGNIVSALLEGGHSSDFKNAIAAGLSAGAGSSTGNKAADLDDLFREVPEDFDDPTEESAPDSERPSIEARRKPTSSDVRFDTLARELNARSGRPDVGLEKLAAFRERHMPDRGGSR